MTPQAKPSRRRARARSAVASLAVLGALLAPLSADAAWPGRNGAIVFEAYRLGGEEGASEEGKGIWSSLAGAPHAQVRRLTSDPTDAEPQVSPDGRWIVFSRGLRPDVYGFPTAYAIFRMRSDGSALTQVTDGLHSDGQASFLRSGKRILFARFAPKPREDRDLYSVSLDGSGLHQVTSGRADDRNPAASPNGRVIAFERSSPPNGPGYYNHVFTARPSGADVRDITPTLPGNDEAREPDFTPDGRRIAFFRQTMGLLTMAPDGSRVRRLTDAPLGEPAFSPDGRMLMLTSTTKYRTSSLRLFLLRGDGIVDCSEALHLNLEIRGPVWQPARGSASRCRLG